MASILEYFIGVSSMAASSGREEKQVRINIQKTRKYLEGLELLLEFDNDIKADRVGSLCRDTSIHRLFTWPLN